jgi:hypothetical protein
MDANNCSSFAPPLVSESYAGERGGAPVDKLQRRNNYSCLFASIRG